MNGWNIQFQGAIHHLENMYTDTLLGKKINYVFQALFSENDVGGQLLYFFINFADKNNLPLMF